MAQQNSLKGLHVDESLDQRLQGVLGDINFSQTFADELPAPKQIVVSYSAISYH